MTNAETRKINEKIDGMFDLSTSVGRQATGWDGLSRFELAFQNLNELLDHQAFPSDGSVAKFLELLTEPEWVARLALYPKSWPSNLKAIV